MIPKILHRICLGKRFAVSCDIRSYEECWRRLHPTWVFKLWTDSNLPSLRNQRLFDICENGGHRADILRYELMYQYGGVYVDLDVEPLMPLDLLLKLNPSGFAGKIEPQVREIGTVELEMAVLGAPPASRFYAYLLERITPWVVRHADQRVSLRTGPQFFQWHLQRWHQETGREGVALLPRHIFYPYRADQPDRAGGPFPGSYAVHRWWSSWKSQPDAWSIRDLIGLLPNRST